MTKQRYNADKKRQAQDYILDEKFKDEVGSGLTASEARDLDDLHGQYRQATEQYLIERIEAERRLFNERVAPFEKQLAHLRAIRPPEYFVPQEKNDD